MITGISSMSSRQLPGRFVIMLFGMLAVLLPLLLSNPAAATVEDKFPPRLRVVATPATSFVQPGGTAMITVTIWGQARHSIKGTLRVGGPEGWTVTPAEQPFEVPSNGVPVPVEYTVEVAAPADAGFGRQTLIFEAKGSGGRDPVEASTEGSVIVSWPPGTTAEASSVHPPGNVTFVAENAIDGDTGSFWNDNTRGGYPDILTLTTPDPVTISGVAILTHSAGWITDFTVQTSSDGETWTTRATVTDNAELDREVGFDQPVTATQIRIVVTGNAPSRFGEFTRLIEFTPIGE